jgi:hypothetical protein
MSKTLCTLLGLLAIPWIGIVTGLAIYYQLVFCWFNLPSAQFTVICCLVLPLLLSTTVVHELGHAIAAWSVRNTVVLISVFGIALCRAGRSGLWRLQRTPRPYSGHCVVTMAPNGQELRRRHLIFILGGVTNNLFVAILCLVAGQALVAAADEAVPIAFLRPNALIIASLNPVTIASPRQ